MAELFFDGIDSLSSTIDRVNRANEELSGAAITETGFAANLDTLDLNADAFEIAGTQGDYYLSRDGERVDLSGAAKAMNEGDLLISLEKLKVPRDIITDPDIKEFAKQYKTTWERQAGIQEIAENRAFQEQGNKLTKQMGDPENVAEFRKILESNFDEVGKEFKTKMEDLKKKIDDSHMEGRGGRVRVGKWVKRGVVFGLGALTLAALYSFIVDHQNSINGCWLVNNSTGEKCKVKTLTCNTNSAFKECTSKYEVCGASKDQPCFAEGVCVKQANGGCSLTIGNSGCKNASCKTYCSNNHLQVPSGYKLVCVNSTFWGAAQDFFNSPFSFVSSWIYWILGIGAVILVLFFVIKK